LHHSFINYEIAHKLVCFAECPRRTPLQLICGNVADRHARSEKYDLCGCPITVKKALEKVSGVTSATVDFDKKTASVTFDPDKASPARLVKATSDAGHPSTVHN
jgi:mercuric ion binding protein